MIPKRLRPDADRFIPSICTDELGNNVGIEPHSADLVEASNTPYGQLLREAFPSVWGPRFYYGYAPQRAPVSDIFDRDSSALLEPLRRTKPRSKGVNIVNTRILDAGGLRDDFYSQPLAMSGANAVHTALNFEENDHRIHTAVFAPNRETTYLETQPYPAARAQSVLALSDDKTVVSGWMDGSLQTHDISTGAAELAFTSTRSVSSKRISALVATGAFHVFCGDGTGRIFSIDLRIPPGSTAATIFYSNEQNTQEITGLAYDGRYNIAAGSNDNIVRVWDKRYAGRKSVYEDRSHSAAIKGLAFHPDKLRYFITGGGTACHKLCLHDLFDPEALKIFEAGSQVTGMFWPKNDPSCLITSHGYSECVVKLWDVSKNTLSVNRTHILPGIAAGSDRIIGLAASPTTNDFAIALPRSEQLRLLKLEGLEQPKPKQDPHKLPYQLSCAPQIR